VDFASLSKRRLSYWIDPHRSASPGIRSRGAPHPTFPFMRPLPDDVAAIVRPVAAKRPTRSVLVVSRHLDGLLRMGALGLLRPKAGRGSLRFPVPIPSVADRSRRTSDVPSLAEASEFPSKRWVSIPFPATRLAPFEEFPSPIAVPRHRGRCPPAVRSTPSRPDAEAPEPTWRPHPTDQRLLPPASCRNSRPAKNRVANTAPFH